MIGAQNARENYSGTRAEVLAKGVLIKELRIPASASGRVAKPFTVYIHKRGACLGRTKDAVLRALAGVTAVRLSENAFVEDWRNEGDLPLAKLNLDGYWRHPQAFARALWAFEYDAGS